MLSGRRKKKTGEEVTTCTILYDLSMTYTFYFFWDFLMPFSRLHNQKAPWNASRVCRHLSICKNVGPVQYRNQHHILDWNATIPTVKSSTHKHAHLAAKRRPSLHKPDFSFSGHEGEAPSYDALWQTAWQDAAADNNQKTHVARRCLKTLSVQF